ncbi:MAG: hypothetical protein P8X55_02600 [Desulfosarcinaceae bacterium]
MPPNSSERLRVNVTVEISAASLQAVVAYAKKLAGKDASGVYRIDTADKVGEMVTRFLDEKDFEAYIKEVCSSGACS